MKVTLNLPDELHRRVKVRAAEGGTTVTSLVEIALRRLLEERDVLPPDYRLPVLPGAGGALPGVDLMDGSALVGLMEQDAPVDGLR